MNRKKLSPRLLAAAEFISKGCRMADIGTDHANLPIYLVSAGKCTGAIAADLRKGPLESAKANISQSGLSDKIETRLSDGFKSIYQNEFDEAVIAGMGGILICDILESCPYKSKKAFVLQPMSDPDIVRRWIYKNGFKITGERAASEGERVYVIIRAEHCGESREISDFEAFAGTLYRNIGNDEKAYFSKLSRTLLRQINGLNSAGKETKSLQKLKDQIETLLR